MTICINLIQKNEGIVMSGQKWESMWLDWHRQLLCVNQTEAHWEILSWKTMDTGHKLNSEKQSDTDGRLGLKALWTEVNGRVSLCFYAILLLQKGFHSVLTFVSTLPWDLLKLIVQIERNITKCSSSCRGNISKFRLSIKKSSSWSGR